MVAEKENQRVTKNKGAETMEQEAGKTRMRDTKGWNGKMGGKECEKRN